VPLLAAALCRYGQFRQRYVKRHLRSFRALLRAPNGMRRWRKVAAWLGFEPSRAFIDLLRRARTDVTWKVSDLCKLREAWANPTIRTHLQHARTIHPATGRVFLLIDTFQAFDRIGPELRAEICELGDSGGFESYFRQIATAYFVLWPGRVLPMLRRVDDLELEREALRVEIRNHFAATLRTRPSHRPIPAEMPAPPFPGTERLVPLPSAEALVAEGTEMQHCIGGAGWAEDARRADGFGYRYRHGDERATLWIRRTLHGRPFEVLQFRGPQNAAPSAEATLHVQHWLESWLTAVEQQQVALAEPWNELPCPLLSDGDRYGVPRALQWAMRDDVDLPEVVFEGQPYRRPRRARRRGRAAPVDINNDAFWAADPPARRPVPGMALWLDYEAHVEIPF
jgi:hypothetical protein